MRQGPPSTTASHGHGDVLGPGGADAAEGVGRGGGDGHAGGAQQVERDGMVGHAQAHGVESTGDDAGDGVGLGQHQGERTGPEGVGELAGQCRHVGRQRPGRVGLGHVHDQRVETGTLLGCEDLRDRVGVERVGPQAVDGLGREGDEVAGAEQLGGTLEVGAERHDDGVVG